MSVFRSRIYKAIVFLSLLSLYYQPRTDADLIDQVTLPTNKWQASTLNLTQQNTIDGDSIIQYFHITRLQAQGFAVASFRLSNQGDSHPQYSINYHPISGDLCPYLQVKMLYQDKIVYQGPLEKLRLDQQIIDSSSSDWITIASLDSYPDLLSTYDCSFRFDISSKSTNSSGNFTDSESLVSYISAK